ncbi:MAG: hypothetical protein NC350_05650, partial [Corallococcus sp.]|nr:hypothetical protein [Corallococcus sp.]
MIQEKTIKKLEYHTILNVLSQYTHSKISQRLALSLRPANSYDDAMLLLRETQQAFALYDRLSLPDMSIDDLSEVFAAARVGSCLTAGQLLGVMRLLKISHGAKKYLSVAYEGVDTSVLSTYAAMLFSDDTLAEDIDFAIISENEINDKASDSLYEIRKRIKRLNAEIKDSLANYTKKGELSKYLQDSIVTLRGDRYVIPVKAEYKSLVNGIVHDTSGSGSTFFIEPIAIVELNNKLRAASVEEKEEVQRILQSFTDRVGAVQERLVVTQQTVAELDVIFAKVLYAVSIKACLPILNNTGLIDLKCARHALIAREKVVPVDLKLGGEYNIIVITGPNTGGKTVSLKTCALLTLMAQSGMYIPAREDSKISFFQQVFCDVGDEQSIEQSLSTFSSHMVNIRDILESCDSHSLVVIDEVGAGTEPNEGAALAVAITDYLRHKGAKCILTTHYEQLKEYSLTTSGVENASMEFNLVTFEPTYRLVLGVPGSSNAIAIAQKLGMNSTVIENARRGLSAEKQNLDAVLRNAEELRQKYETQLELVSQREKKLTEEIARSQKINEGLTRERDKFLAGSKAEARRIVSEAQEESKRIIDSIKHLLDEDGVSDKMLFDARRRAKQLGSLVEDEDDSGDSDVIFVGDNVKFENLKVGDIVYSKKLGVQVKVENIRSQERIFVRAGSLS